MKKKVIGYLLTALVVFSAAFALISEIQCIVTLIQTTKEVKE